jgi:carbonic anhydrase
MSGAEQSPIVLRNLIPAQLGPLQLHWKPGKVEVEGHETILFLDNGSMTLDGVVYKLVKGHMHRPSEHFIGDQRFDMEIHLIHEAKETKLLSVVGIFVKAAKVKSKVFEQLMRDGGPGEFDPNSLLPKELAYARYAGSLTTTPFSEIVTWSVLLQPIRAAQNQLDLCPEHARELWPQNRRYVLRGG